MQSQCGAYRREGQLYIICEAFRDCDNQQQSDRDEPSNLRQQSPQVYMRLIYEAIEKLREKGNKVAIERIPVSDETELVMVAGIEARELTKGSATPQRHFPRMRSTTLNIQK